MGKCSHFRLRNRGYDTNVETTLGDRAATAAGHGTGKSANKRRTCLTVPSTANVNGTS